VGAGFLVDLLTFLWYNDPLGATMNQRIARMKPASMNSHDNPSIHVTTLINFMGAAQKALEARGEMDEAFRFECIVQYLRNDYRSGTPLLFSGGAIGL
jgi:hypothetical protein